MTKFFCFLFFALSFCPVVFSMDEKIAELNLRYTFEEEQFDFGVEQRVPKTIRENIKNGEYDEIVKNGVFYGKTEVTEEEKQTLVGDCISPYKNNFLLPGHLHKNWSIDRNTLFIKTAATMVADKIREMENIEVSSEDLTEVLLDKVKAVVKNKRKDDCKRYKEEAKYLATYVRKQDVFKEWVKQIMKEHALFKSVENVPTRLKVGDAMVKGLVNKNTVGKILLGEGKNLEKNTVRGPGTYELGVEIKADGKLLTMLTATRIIAEMRDVLVEDLNKELDKKMNKAVAADNLRNKRKKFCGIGLAAVGCLFLISPSFLKNFENISIFGRIFKRIWSTRVAAFVPLACGTYLAWMGFSPRNKKLI